MLPQGTLAFTYVLDAQLVLFPPIIPITLPAELCSTGSSAEAIILKIQNNVADTKDNLLLEKITQAAMANSKCGEEIQYKVDNKVMLSTFHRCHKYKIKGDGWVAKFFPRWDGPHMIANAHPELGYGRKVLCFKHRLINTFSTLF